MSDSSSAESEPGWLARADFLSGRTMGQWRLTTHQAQQLLDIWTGLAPAQLSAATLPRLGYRGCIVEDDSGGIWRASDADVTRETTSVQETRRDPQQAFERLVLASAPTGSLPQGLLD